MKLFIDTSNKKLILAIINDENKVINFFITNTNNDVIKKSITEIEKFLKHANLTLNKINEFFITIGPGSFTGVKVALNIVSSIELVQKIEKIHIINTFNLIEDKKFKETVIPFGKNKFYYKRKNKSKITVINVEQFNNLENVNNGYENFDANKLQEKIDDKEFKIVDNLDKIKIKYLSIF